ncbi:TVP38/TMEM64 family protein [Kozakia baliensis]|uniref:TVP38/TMEM64 family protein n=1 Tax=Kozakia baliensis TaxID=153496 RepID=UPI00089DB673|nr:VTT domain-containing protein [Kozakia baliensis]
MARTSCFSSSRWSRTLPDPTPPARPALAGLGKPLLTIVFLLIVLFAAHRLPLTQSLLDLAASWRHNRAAPLLFLLIGLPYSAFGLPRQALCLAAGMVFGTGFGLVLASVATLGGNLAGFWWVRWPGTPEDRARWQNRFRGKLAPVGHALKVSPFQAVLTLRLMPVGSALFVTLAAGFYGIPFWPFLWATFLGALPQNLVFVLIGTGAHIGHGLQLSLGAALFIGSALLGIALMRRARREGSTLLEAASTTENDKKVN